MDVWRNSAVKDFNMLLVACDAALYVTEGRYILSRIDLYERLKGDFCSALWDLRLDVNQVPALLDRSKRVSPWP